MPPVTFQNPVLPGFYPDPSICRVGDDYYLVTSTFEYFPGLPIFHSRDLVHWHPIGHVLDRPSQLDLDGLRSSHGLFAPTIRHHDGTFYVVNTLIAEDGDRPDERSRPRGNFIVTATDPAGPWSDPVWLPDADGIDPSLFFDADGRCWYTGNRIPPVGATAPHHREIWLQELDLATLQLTGPVTALWDGALKGAWHAEAPHLYKHDGFYYLVIAEGGTERNHAVTVARASAVTGPYEPCPHNPILTHRHLGLAYSVAATGHADLVQTGAGEWWMVLLAIRPRGGTFHNLGREVFLAPVVWEEGWPVVAPGLGRVPDVHPMPALPPHPWPSAPSRCTFDGDALGLEWLFVRTPREEWWTLGDGLRIRLRPDTLMAREQPSFIGRRQQHHAFSAETQMRFVPHSANECAGLALRQNEDHQIRFVVTTTAEGGRLCRVVRREAGVDVEMGSVAVERDEVGLRISAEDQAYSFAILSNGQWQPVAEAVDGRCLSTQVAGGFTGTLIGLYASSNGESSENSAEFAWFSYENQEGGDTAESAK